MKKELTADFVLGIFFFFALLLAMAYCGVKWVGPDSAQAAPAYVQAEALAVAPSETDYRGWFVTAETVGQPAKTISVEPMPPIKSETQYIENRTVTITYKFNVSTRFSLAQ